ncbi:MAG TPA: hypothetical protein P5525_13145 [Candidatus Paceibacterota bacterium]|nr:hypothetical protein [Candidatus Paceibacterota bacterium]
MNTEFGIGRPFSNRRVWIAVAALGLGLNWLTPSAQEPPPAEARSEAARLEEKAADLKAAGRHEAAMGLMVEARKIRDEAGRSEFRGQQRPAVVERRHALKSRLEELRHELERQTAEGHEAEADELRQQIERVERALRGFDGPPGQRPFERGEKPRPEGRPEAMGMQRRLAHLQRAIEALRTGGMPDLAERLAQVEAQMRNELGRPGGRPGLREAAVGEIGRLRAEMQELREGMQQLKRRLEEVARREPLSQDRSQAPR